MVILLVILRAVSHPRPEGNLKNVRKSWRRRPDLNRGWRFCRPLPYHLATAPYVWGCLPVSIGIVGTSLTPSLPGASNEFIALSPSSANFANISAPLHSPHVHASARRLRVTRPGRQIRVIEEALHVILGHAPSSKREPASRRKS